MNARVLPYMYTWDQSTFWLKRKTILEIKYTINKCDRNKMRFYHNLTICGKSYLG